MYAFVKGGGANANTVNYLYENRVNAPGAGTISQATFNEGWHKSEELMWITTSQ